eukprot:10012-Heterococcus_DN1.PRE.4
MLDLCGACRSRVLPRLELSVAHSSFADLEQKTYAYYVHTYDSSVAHHTSNDCSNGLAATTAARHGYATPIAAAVALLLALLLLLLLSAATPGASSSRHCVARSYAKPALNTALSAMRGPMICSPIGKPALSMPHGKLSAGRPASDAGTVNRSSL